jgi:type VI secretion system protein ImpL
MLVRALVPVGRSLSDDPEVQQLIELQVRHYSQRAAVHNPVQLEKVESAVKYAREYLNQVKSETRIYQAILEDVRQSVKGPLKFTGDLKGTIKLSVEVPREFTPAGWEVFREKSQRADMIGAGDPCILPLGGNKDRQETRLVKRVRERYLDEYEQRWKDYIRGTSIESFGSDLDAARRLTELSKPTSPLLAVIAFASDNTALPTGAVEKPVVWVDKQIERLKPGGKTPATQPAAPIERDSPERLARTFQSLHVVVPPHQTMRIVESNKAYVDALAELGTSMEGISRVTTAEKPAAAQVALATYDKARSAARQVAQGFSTVGVEDVVTEVTRLLEAPILAAHARIPANPEKAAGAKMAADLRRLCSEVVAIQKKYPFDPARQDEASLAEFSALFAPKSGAIWRYQQESLAELAVKQAGRWAQNPGAASPRLSRELLEFLNKAQLITDTMFDGGSGLPSMVYNLRADGKSLGPYTLTLAFDGKEQSYSESNVMQKLFLWPAPAGHTSGGKAWIQKVGTQRIYVGSAAGVWGVFKVFRDADPREVGDRTVQWSSYTVPGGGKEKFEQPIRIDVIDRPVAQLLHPAFFHSFRCPSAAVQ